MDNWKEEQMVEGGKENTLFNFLGTSNKNYSKKLVKKELGS